MACFQRSELLRQPLPSSTSLRFNVGPPKFTFGCSGCLLVAVALGLGLDAPGVGVGLSGFVSFRWGSTTEGAWAPTQEPAVIRRSLDGSSLAVSVAIQGVSY